MHRVTVRCSPSDRPAAPEHFVVRMGRDNENRLVHASLPIDSIICHSSFSVFPEISLLKNVRACHNFAVDQSHHWIAHSHLMTCAGNLNRISFAGFPAYIP